MKNLGQTFSAVLLAAALLAGQASRLCAEGPAMDMPETRPSEELSLPTSLPASPADTPQTRRLKLILADRAGQLAATDEASAPKAKAALLALQQAALDAVADLTDDEDVEVRQAAADLLAKCALQCRLARMAAMMTPQHARQLRRLQASRPALAAQLVSDDMSARVAAIRKLASLRETAALCEPVLAMCLWHSYLPLRTAAAEIVSEKDLHSPEILDAMTEVLVQGIRRQNSYGAGVTVENCAIGTLYRHRPKNAAGKIYAAVRETGGYRGSVYVDLLVQLDEKRLVPTLIAQIGSRHNYTDPVTLALVLRLTNQALEDYGEQFFAYSPSVPENGNYEVKDMPKAVEKLQQWWEKNKDTPAWRDVKPMAIPKLPRYQPEQSTTIEEMDDEDAPAATIDEPAENATPATTGPSADAALYDVAGLAAQVRKSIAAGAPGLGSRHARERARAREEILALHQLLLDAMLRAKADAADGQASEVLPMLTAMASRAEQTSRRLAMSAEDRQMLDQYARRHPKVVDYFFSPVWKQQEQAVQKIQSTLDTQGYAQPLVLLALKHPYGPIRARALTIVGNVNDQSVSPYRSDQVVDALCDQISARLAAGIYSTRNYHRFYGADRAEMLDEQKVVRALASIKSKRAAPTLLQMVYARRDRRIYRGNCPDAVVAGALGATGELRAIGPLMEVLQKPDMMAWSMNRGKETIHVSDRDTAFYALLKLTGEKPQTYGMIVRDTSDSYGYPVIGFANPAERQKAYDKFRQWWQKQQNDPRYKDLKPLATPMGV